MSGPAGQATCDATILDEGQPRRCQEDDGHYPTTRHRSVLRDGANVLTWNDDAKHSTPASSSPPRVTVSTTRYTVSALPETDINYRHAAIHIEYLGRNLRDGTEHWVAVNLGAYLHPDGHWVDHKSYSWPDSDSAIAAAQAAIHTTPSAIAADAIARGKEQ